jgi:hypothetical protein
LLIFELKGWAIAVDCIFILIVIAACVGGFVGLKYE